MRDFLPTNLKHLCAHYRSISDVCRRLNIHRGQFNKYLNGSSVPASFNLKRICDFFGVEEYEIYLPSEQFSRLISSRKVQTSPPQVAAPQRALELLRQRSSTRLENLVGYYYEYVNSTAHAGRIFCALVSIQKVDGYFVYEREERSSVGGQGVANSVCHRYHGVVFYLGDRIFLIDYESLAASEINQTILIPNFKNQNTRLNGMKMGVTTCDHRAPVCSRVVWDTLGKEVSHREVGRKIRAYLVDDPELDVDLKERLLRI